MAHGYGSTEAFNRAFLAVHGVTAGRARRDRPPLVSRPRVAFHLTIEGSASMRYRLVDKPAFRVIGCITRVPLVHLGRNEAIEAFARGLDPTVVDRIDALSDQEPAGAISVTDSLDDSREEGTELDYWLAAVTAAPTSVPDGLDVPAGTWLVLSTTGPYPEALQLLWRDAYTEWFPANPWRTGPGPDLLRAEIHDDGTADGDL